MLSAVVSLLFPAKKRQRRLSRPYRRCHQRHRRNRRYQQPLHRFPLRNHQLHCNPANLLNLLFQRLLPCRYILRSRRRWSPPTSRPRIRASHPRPLVYATKTTRSRHVTRTGILVGRMDCVYDRLKAFRFVLPIVPLRCVRLRRIVRRGKSLCSVLCFRSYTQNQSNQLLLVFSQQCFSGISACQGTSFCVVELRS